MGDKAKFLTWCTYKVGVRPHIPKKWGSGPRPPKITPMATVMIFRPDVCRMNDLSPKRLATEKYKNIKNIKAHH